ncbi:MAG: hypothetical protein HEP71_15240 [Roseivirga sp.]|nr:hypothetical protein [Roseivirga sp.]
MRWLLIINGLLLFGFVNAQEADVLANFTLEYHESYRLSMKSINTTMDEMEAEEEGKDRVINAFINEFYRIFHEEYAASLNLNPLPLTNYPEGFNMNAYELPEMSPKRAAKGLMGNSLYTVQIRMERGGLGGSDTGGLTIKEIGIKGDKKKFKPRLVVRVMIFNDKGKRTKNVKGAATSKERIVLKQNSFLRIATVGKNSTIEDSQQVILDTFRKALDELVEKF